jgi:hypothetical protein
MAFSVITFIKSLIIQTEGTLTPASIEITPAGTAGTKTTVVSSQTANRTITLPDTTGTMLLNPMTTSGDLMYGGAGGVVTRLGNGTANQVLTSNGTTVAPSWQGAGGVATVTEGDLIQNVSLAASVATNSLTISLKVAAGTDATGSDQVKIGFRSITLTSGVISLVAHSAALSTVISSGSTAGHTSAVEGQLYIYAINNAGAIELAWSSIYQDETKLVTTTAEGGAGGADSISTIYSTTARTGVACRLIGRMLSTQTTAGLWAAVPTNIQVGSIGKLGGMINPMTTSGDIIYSSNGGMPTRLANGTSGQFLKSNGTTLAPSWANTSGSGGGGVIHVRDEKATATNGGASSTATHHIRTLNTVVTNTISGASLASNKITLPAGTYNIRASAPALAAGLHRIRLVNVTDSTVVLLGSSAYNDGPNYIETHSFISGQFTLAGTKDLNITHYIQVADSDGLGKAVNDTFVNVYTSVFIEKT